MLDFNDQPNGELESRAKRDEVLTDLMGKLESVLFTLYPAGKVRHVPNALPLHNTIPL